MLTVTLNACCARKAASSAFNTVAFVVIEKRIDTPRSAASVAACKVARRSTSRLSSGSPPRNARLALPPAGTRASRSSTARRATSQFMCLGALAPKLPPSA